MLRLRDVLHDASSVCKYSFHEIQPFNHGKITVTHSLERLFNKKFRNVLFFPQ